MRAEISASRSEWVDIAKGICIIFVVMVHSTLGVEIAAGSEGWMHQVVAFARPFRMPDFFMISGLFLALVIDRPWRLYLDRKVVHFFYFYILWLSIQFAFKAPGMAMESGAMHAISAYFWAFIQPFGTLWFIYILPVMFIVTRWLKPVPVPILFAGAALLEILPIHTGWVTFDEFCSRYVYFFAGYAFAPHIFAVARWLKERPAIALITLVLWAPVNGLLVFADTPETLKFLIQDHNGAAGATGGLAELPLISIALGFAGAMAIVSVASLVSGKMWSRWLDWLGRHSIVVYLAFFLPMATTRIVLVKSGLIADVGTMSLLTLIAGVSGPVILHFMIKWTGWGKFLFERPDWAKIDKPSKNLAAAPVPAE
ncbi:MAG: acyltransferase family protein [Rhizobiaceae bacterium]